jgi:hypothetical protein
MGSLPKSAARERSLVWALREVPGDVLERHSASSGSNLPIHFVQSNHSLNLAAQCESDAVASFFSHRGKRVQLDQPGTAKGASRGLREGAQKRGGTRVEKKRQFQIRKSRYPAHL